jgi:hypothetical protein
LNSFFCRTFHFFSLILFKISSKSLHFSFFPSIRPGHEEEALLTARVAEAGADAMAVITAGCRVHCVLGRSSEEEVAIETSQQ